jgi:hypothetical protein
VCTEPEGTILRRGHRVQDRGAVRVEDTLRISGRTGRVAQRARQPLVERWPGANVAGVSEQTFRGDNRDGAQRWEVRALAEQNDLLDGLKFPVQPRNRRQKIRIDEQQAIPGMVDDVGNLGIEEPWIDGMQHGAETGNPIEKLEMPMGAGRERTDPITACDAQFGHQVGNPTGPSLGLLVSVAVQATVGLAADDLGSRVANRRMNQQRGDQERILLHQSEQRLAGAHEYGNKGSLDTL